MIHDCSDNIRLNVRFDTSFAYVASGVLNSRIHVLIPDNKSKGFIIVDELDADKNHIKDIFEAEVSQTTGYRFEKILRMFWAANFDGKAAHMTTLDSVLGYNCYGELVELVKMLIAFAQQVTINNNK